MKPILFYLNQHMKNLKRNKILNTDIFVFRHLEKIEFLRKTKPRKYTHSVDKLFRMGLFETCILKYMWRSYQR